MVSAKNLTTWLRTPAGLALLAGLLLVQAPAVAGAATSTKLGSVTLHRCAQPKVAWCGTLERPWNPAQTSLGSFSVAFKVFLPPVRSHGTIVAVEGGPGYPSTGSAPEYRAVYRPLLKTHTLLLIDNRGTGGTALIACKALEQYQKRTDTAAFQALVGACGRSLGARVNLYRTYRAADDMAAVVKALGVGKIDLYGDSYGSWFAQVFAHRHPAMLRSLVLDSTYSRTAIDPWYRSTLSTERTAFRAVCNRDVACSRIGGDSWARIAKLVSQLRQRPISGWTRDPEGDRVFQVVTVRTMVDVSSDAGFDPLMYRDLDAAVRAASHGIRQPLLRIAATAASNDNSTGTSAYDYSNGQFFAVSCSDYPQLFSVSDPISARPAQLQASLAAAPTAALAPFRPSEWISMNQYSEAFTACLDWPKLPAHDPGANAAGSGGPVPTLVLGGDLDSWTPLTDAVGITRTLGPLARLVTLRNAVHTATEGDVVPTAATNCGRAIVRRFVLDPAAIKTLNASCGSHIAPIHTPGTFPLRLSGATGATVTSGTAGASARKAATVAVQAIGDATQSWWADDNDSGAGLYGGRFSGSQNGSTVAFKLTNDRFVADARVTGTATWRLPTGAVHANLTVRSGGHTYRFELSYSQTTPHATVVSAHARLSTPAA